MFVLICLEIVVCCWQFVLSSGVWIVWFVNWNWNKMFKTCISSFFLVTFLLEPEFLSVISDEFSLGVHLLSKGVVTIFVQKNHFYSGQ